MKSLAIFLGSERNRTGNLTHILIFQKILHKIGSSSEFVSTSPPQNAALRKLIFRAKWQMLQLTVQFRLVFLLRLVPGRSLRYSFGAVVYNPVFIGLVERRGTESVGIANLLKKLTRETKGEVPGQHKWVKKHPLCGRTLLRVLRQRHLHEAERKIDEG